MLHLIGTLKENDKMVRKLLILERIDMLQLKFDVLDNEDSLPLLEYAKREFGIIAF